MRAALARAAVALLLAGCTESSPPAERPHTSPAPPPPASATPSPPALDDLTTSFHQLSATISGKVGIVVVSGSSTRSFGTWSSGPAWSTVKVPLAIAALRRSPEKAGSLEVRAITRSDNAAAEALWAMLGDPATAARAVETVLREAGDAATVVEAERVRPGFTAFGQTEWPIQAQARFASRLPCLADADDVLADMPRLGAEQQWGLAGDGDVAAKGGWGPGVDGGYLVRQLATVTDPTGAFGVALAAQPADGTFESGVAAVNQLADWFDQHRPQFRPVAC